MDIHNREERAENQKTLFLNNDKVPQETKELITQFIQDKIRKEDIKFLTQAKYYKIFKQSYEYNFLTQPISKTQQELLDIRDRIKKSDYKGSTGGTYFISIKAFYKWYKQTYKKEISREFKDVIDEFIEQQWKGNGERKEDKPTLTQEEITKMLEACDNPRDACLIMVLLNTGRRVEGVLNLRIKDLDKKGWKYGYTLNFTVEKTEASRGKARVYKAVPYINKWLDVHPLKNDPEVPLFTMTKRIGNRKHGDKKTKEYVALSYGATRKILEKVTLSSGITKNVTPHTFRRTAATLAAEDGWNNPKIEDAYGWKRGSKVLASYVKGINMDEAWAEREGLIQKKEEDKLKPLQCPICKTINPATQDYCGNCHRPLSLEVALENEDDTNKRVDDLMSDVEWMKNQLMKIANK